MKRLFICLFLFSLGMSAQAQQSNLNNLSSGILTNFQIIKDNDKKLFGYLLIYQLGNVDKVTKKFEYVFLDKNLNTVSSKAFNESAFANNYSGEIEDDGQFLLQPQYNVLYAKPKKYEYPRTYVIDMKNNTLTLREAYCFYNDSVQICKPGNRDLGGYKDINEKQKKEGYLKRVDIKHLSAGGFLVYDYKDVGKNIYVDYNADDRLLRLDKDNNKLWEFTFNEDASRNKYEDYHWIDWNDNYGYIIKTEHRKNKTHHYFVVLDLVQGKVASEFDISTNYPDFNKWDINFYKLKSIENSKETDQYFKLIMPYLEKDTKKGFLAFNYDKASNKITLNTLNFKDLNDVTDEIEVKENGELKGEAEGLKCRDMYFLEDGSVGILAEKARSKSAKEVTTDLVLISTDTNFNPKEVSILEKDRSKTRRPSDYLFSQYINDGKDVVFFYRDFQKDDDTKDKNWVLYINTIIDGEFQQEEIPISSDDNYIYPIMAKEGYILLREFNTNDKYDEIRLERLNY